jgi:hypothetical protein
MSKLVFASSIAAAVLGLAACGDRRQDHLAVQKVEVLNATEDMDADIDMNTHMNMDMDKSAPDNGMDNAVEKGTDNSASTKDFWM